MSPKGYLRQQISDASSKRTSLAERARARLQALEANQPREALTSNSLLKFVPLVQHGCEEPLHLLSYVNILQDAIGTEKRCVIAAPPQHGKTTLTIAALVWWALLFPHLSFVYATYSTERAEQVSKQAQAVADAAGLECSSQTLGLWRLKGGGQILWTSVGGRLTGNPASGVIVVDDPISGPKDANSPTVRRNIQDWFVQNCFTRRHPGTSFIVMATRWHTDDLSGSLVRSSGFEYINLKAIADEKRPVGDDRQPGEALWPSQRPLSFLEESRRINVWAFAAMYQGEPRPRGGSLFRDPSYWSELPADGFKISFGVDLSYTEKTHADFSVCVELWAVPPRRGLGDQTLHGWSFYIVDVVRKQVEAPAFALTLRAKSSQSPGKFWWYASGTEKGSAQFIKSKGIPLTVMDPKGRDKYTRAQQTSELWNAGRIFVPADSEANPWVDVFVDEVTSFTGVKDLHDDQVDALVAAVDAALAGGSGGIDIPRRSGGGRWG